MVIVINDYIFLLNVIFVVTLLIAFVATLARKAFMVKNKKRQGLCLDAFCDCNSSMIRTICWGIRQPR